MPGIDMTKFAGLKQSPAKTQMPDVSPYDIRLIQDTDNMTRLRLALALK